jgi:aspartyl-tRNA(Asn)/glutamyl-tRNA(Gln) amidotransferase subunit A
VPAHYDAHFKKAGQVRTLIKQDFDKVFADYDLIIGPSSPTVAFGIGENINDPITMYMSDILTIPVNLAGSSRHVCTSWILRRTANRIADHRETL